MDTMEAYARGQASRGNVPKVFDWDKAARIIRERGATHAIAGLAEDFDWTGGPILRDGKRLCGDETYTFLASSWATPVLVIDDEEIECWIQTTDTKWDAYTQWPESAVAIMESP